MLQAVCLLYEAHQSEGSGRNHTQNPDWCMATPTPEECGHVQKWYNTFGNHDIVIDGAHATKCHFQPMWCSQCSYRASETPQLQEYIVGHLCRALYLKWLL